MNSLPKLSADTSLPIFLILPADQFGSEQAASFISRVFTKLKASFPHRVVVFTDCAHLSAICDENQIPHENLENFLDTSSSSCKKGIKKAQPRFMRFNHGQPFARVLFQPPCDFTDEDFFLELLEHFQRRQKVLKLLSVTPIPDGHVLELSKNGVNSIPRDAGTYFFTHSKLDIITYTNFLAIGNSSISLLSKLQDDPTLSPANREECLKTFTQHLSRYTNPVSALRDEQELEVYFQNTSSPEEPEPKTYIFDKNAWVSVDKNFPLNGLPPCPHQWRSELDRDPFIRGKAICVSRQDPDTEIINNDRPQIKLRTDFYPPNAIRYFEIQAAALATLSGKSITSSLNKGFSCSISEDNLVLRAESSLEEFTNHTLFLAFHSFTDSSVSKVEYVLSGETDLKIKGDVPFIDPASTPSQREKSIILPLLNEPREGILLVQTRKPLHDPSGFAHVATDFISLGTGLDFQGDTPDTSQRQYAVWNGEYFLPATVRQGDSWITTRAVS